MSQEQQITSIPGLTMYEDKQDMLNGNGGSTIVPHPQPGVPDIQGVQREGQVEGVVEEPAEVGAPSAAEFQGPRIFVHAPRYAWHSDVHVQGPDEEACQRIVAMEEPAEVGAPGAAEFQGPRIFVHGPPYASSGIQRYCALCPGVIEWHNYGTVLGVLESSLGIGLDKYLHFVTFYVGMGPL